MRKIWRSSDGRAPQQPWVSLVRIQPHTLSLFYFSFIREGVFMRLKKYASSKVVAIILTAMVVLGGLFFQNRQIQNLKKQLSD